MDINELNKTQLLLLAILLSFVTSLATGITTVTLMEQAPRAVTIPINRIVKQTIEKVVPAESSKLTTEQEKFLQDLKTIQPLTVSVYLKGDKEDKLLGTGLFLGENKVVLASLIPEPKEGEKYIVKSILGEKEVLKVNPQKDFTIIELLQEKTDVVPEEESSNL
jgi:hypothetical protein